MFALLGSLLGFGTSFLPKVMDYFQDKQDKAHELAMMDKQLAQQQALGEIKLQMTEIEADVEEGKSLRRHDASLQKSASQWVTNLAASVRPMITYLLFLAWFFVNFAVAQGWLTMVQYQGVWDEHAHALMAAVLSFWFGSRAISRRVPT